MQIDALVIADSISKEGYRIITQEVTLPRPILAELNTHRMIVKSAASSRAIPVAKRIEMVRNEMFMPAKFGLNEPGMQASNILEDAAQKAAEEVWRDAALAAADYADELVDLGVHKQHANRLLEPFVYVKAVVTYTESENLYALRDHPDAQPEFLLLARAMRAAETNSTPKTLDDDQWHIPYLTTDEDSLDLMTRLRISAARCARISYRTHDGKIPDTEKDLALSASLLSSGHMSPFDHQAIPAKGTSYPPLHLERMMRQFVGWVPYRAFLEEAPGQTRRRFYKHHGEE